MDEVQLGCLYSYVECAVCDLRTPESRNAFGLMMDEIIPIINMAFLKKSTQPVSATKVFEFENTHQ